MPLVALRAAESDDCRRSRGDEDVSSYVLPAPEVTRLLLAADGASALSLAETFQPECAIVDISMPGMNGLELSRRLRQRFSQTQLYLIALSGYPDADLREGITAYRRRFRCVSG